MKFVLPRVILGNRGDLASRWSLLRSMQALNIVPVAVFSYSLKDIPYPHFSSVPYGKMHNFILTASGQQAFRQADTVLWGVGLDLQDDSSLTKLLYLTILFLKYRLMGMRILVLFQGAGPIDTYLGKFLARQVLKTVDLFVARDPGTHKLIKQLHPDLNSMLGHDAIFLPYLEKELSPPRKESDLLTITHPDDNRPLIGFNLRQWFHFASSIVPYKLSREKYLQRSQDHMKRLLNSATEVIQELRKYGRILLISAYQPGIVPWEDDLYWLTQIKARFEDDSNVILVNQPMSIPTYFYFMSRLELMIGMRLHSTLIALRFGVPSLNISYTLKGKDIMKYLGLPENVVEIDDFLASPEIITQRAKYILDHYKVESTKTTEVVAKAIDHNLSILHQIFNI